MTPILSDGERDLMDELNRDAMDGEPSVDYAATPAYDTPHYDEHPGEYGRDDEFDDSDPFADDVEATPQQLLRRAQAAADSAPRATLFEIGQDAAALDALLCDIGGDVSDEKLDAAIDTWLVANENALQQKADGYCALIREYEARAERRLNEAQRLRALAQSDKGHAERLKKRLHDFMTTHNRPKIETERFRIGVHKTGGRPELHFLTDKELPEAYRRVIVAPDTEAIYAALKRHEPLDFVEARERGTHLSIR